MTDIVALVRSPIIPRLFGAPRREPHPDPWLDLLLARSCGEELLVPLGKGPRPELAITATEYERSRQNGRAEVHEGRVYLVHERRVRGYARLVAMMLSAADGWLIIAAMDTFVPMTIAAPVRWFPGVLAPWWRQWPSSEERDGVEGDEELFPQWKTEGVRSDLLNDIEAIAEPVRAEPIGLIVCTRSKKKKGKPCSVCGVPGATLLCDAPTKGKKTCDKPLCESCTSKAGKLDLCPEHAGMASTHRPRSAPAGANVAANASQGATSQGTLFEEPRAPAVRRAAPRPSFDGPKTLDLFAPRGKP